MNDFLLLPILVATLLSAYFLWRGNYGSAKQVIGFYFLLFSVILTSLNLLSSNQKTIFPEAVINIFSLLFYVALIAIPPTFLLLVRRLSKLKDDPLYVKTHYFLPLLLLLCNTICFLFFQIQTDEQSYSYEVMSTVMNYANYLAILLIFPIMLIYYMFTALRIYRTHRAEMDDLYSYKIGYNKAWVLSHLIGFFAFMSMVYLLFAGDWVSSNFYLLSQGLILCYILFVASSGIRIKRLDFLLLKDKISQEPQEEVINSSNWNKLESDLIRVMDQERPYLASDLTIFDLSKSVGTNSKYLSKVINQHIGKNFSTFINDYRLEEAKRLLASKEGNTFTIEAIAQMSGFKSKSVFNAYFKKKYQMTPSKYRSEVR